MKLGVGVHPFHVIRINKMLSCAGADRLQQGMRGAWGKPAGTVARVRVNQILLSIRTKDANRVHVIEALRRARNKFPGTQKIIVSRNWGFTDVERGEFVELLEKGEARIDGNYVKYWRRGGKVEEMMREFPGAFGIEKLREVERVEEVEA